MRYIGFFDEMNTTLANNGSIKDAVIDEISYDRKAVVSYLKAGRELAYSGKDSFDLFTGDIIAPGFSLQTDGVFGWRGDLAYHVENYNIDLPKDFIMHVMLNSGAPKSKA